MFQALIRLFSCSHPEASHVYRHLSEGIMAAGVLPRPGYESCPMGSVPATLFHGRKSKYVHEACNQALGTTPTLLTAAQKDL